MKKYIVIGNPIEHSLSPKLHNYWMKKNNVKATYEKKKINENDIEFLVSLIKKEEITGANVTIPFKKKVIPFMDELSPSTLDSVESESDLNVSWDVSLNSSKSGFVFSFRFFGVFWGAKGRRMVKL